VSHDILLSTGVASLQHGTKSPCSPNTLSSVFSHLASPTQCKVRAMGDDTISFLNQVATGERSV